MERQQVICQYEAMLIFSVKNGEESVQALSDKFQKLIADNGTVDKVDEWGKRRLAYPIQDELEAYYLLVTFTSNADLPAELDRVLKITDGVLRSMIIHLDDIQG